MALMNLDGSVATENGAPVEVKEAMQPVVSNNEREALLAKKRETARKCNAKKKEKEAKQRERAAKLKNELVSKGIFETLSEESKLFLKSISTEQPSVRGGAMLFLCSCLGEILK